MQNDMKDAIKKITDKLQELKATTDSKDILLKDLSKIITESDLPGKTKFENYNFFLRDNGIQNVFKNLKLKGEDFDLQKGLSLNENSSPQEMLLFALVWKNGDLGKEHSIITGLMQEAGIGNSLDAYGYPVIYSETAEDTRKNNSKTTSTVFYQFGLFLKTFSLYKDEPDGYSKIEPIMDQHSMRAFIYTKDSENYSSVIDKNSAQEYKEWHKEIIEKAENKEKAFFILNEVMFLLGKTIKSVYGDRKK